MNTLLSDFVRVAWRRAAPALLAGLFVFSFVGPAHAGGKVIWKPTTIAEKTSNESWMLNVEIHLNKAPDIAYPSMNFEFVQLSEFERSLVDGREGPQLTTTQLSNQQAIIESQTVGFSDPSSEVPQKRTRFSFKITRGHGYRAGEWKVTLKDAETGQVIGSPTTLRLNGENEVVDRRSIVFQGKDKKDEKEKEPAAAADAPKEEGAGESSDATDSSSDAPPEDEGQAPPSVDERPGGGCHHTPHDTPLGWPLLGLGFVAVMIARRYSQV
jgi:hypothetical protein